MRCLGPGVSLQHSCQSRAALARLVLHSVQQSKMPLERWERTMVTRKKIALYLLAGLVVAGAYDALRNLPVLSGCNFYSDCPKNDTSRAAD